MKLVDPSGYESTLSYDALSRLDQSLARTERGSLHDLVSPLVKDKFKPTMGRELRITETLINILPTGYAWLDEAEMMQMEKIGPYSVMLPYREREESVLKYFEKHPTAIDEGALAYAFTSLTNEVQETLSPVSVDIAFDSMPKGTNLGLPWLSKLKKYLPEVLDKVLDVVGSGYQIEDLDPAILYWRGQPRGLIELPKQRVVWGFPHYITVLELMLQIPVLNCLEFKPGFSAWRGPDAVDGEITKLIDRARVEILSVDFSSYDASVPRVLIEKVFDVLRIWFDDSAIPLIDYVEHAFLNIGLFTPIGVLTDRDGSIPSGSGVTNLVGGLVQKLAFYYVAYQMNNRVLAHLVQGDDGVVLFDKPWDLSDVEEIMQELNLKVSADKGGVSRDRVYYLQNIHSSDYRIQGTCVRVRPFFKVLNGALSYERFHAAKDWGPADDSIRWYQQWEAAKFHPKFPECVRLLYDWDSYTRKFTPDQLVKKAGGLEELKSVLGIKAFPYGKEDLNGLNGFRVVRLLQEMKSHNFQ